MADGTNMIGGFAALNTGTIKDCYCIFIKKNKKTPGCFAAKNNGHITTSFSTEKNRYQDLWDEKGMLVSRRIRKKRDVQEMGYDLEKSWLFDEDDNSLCFRDENWEKKLVIPQGKRKQSIKNEADFLRFIDLVNKGDTQAVKAYIRLERDLDLKGKNIDPIGNTRQNAFQGILDGNGHSIKNFTVKKQDISNLGLFGILKGAVINLLIDCEVTGEGNVGALCGINEGSIFCSGAVADIRGSGDKLRMGGFCGQNLGNIVMCYVAVRESVVPLPILPMGIAVATVFLIGTVAFRLIPAADIATRTFATVDTDKKQIRITDDTTEDKPDEEQSSESPVNSMEFQFNETLHVDPANGNCYLYFVNPSYSKNMIVIRLEADNEEHTVMAKSGAVTPGHKLDYLTFEDAGYDLINSGMRTGRIVLTAYNSETSEKALIESDLPVRIEID